MVNTRQRLPGRPRSTRGLSIRQIVSEVNGTASSIKPGYRLAAMDRLSFVSDEQLLEFAFDMLALCHEEQVLSKRADKWLVDNRTYDALKARILILRSRRNV